MTQNRHTAIAAVGIAFALFPPLTAADLYLSADRSGILPINATMITFLCLSSALGLILFSGLAHDRGRGLCLTYLATAPVLVAFLLLMMVQLAGGFLPGAYWAGSGKFVYLPLYGFVVLMLSVGIASAPAFRQYHRAILSACLLAAAASIFVDMFYPATFAQFNTRPAGFAKNPNGGAATVIILAIATVDWTRSRASDMLLWVIAGTAVVATMSRGGMASFALMFLLYSIVAARSGLQLYAKRLSIVFVAMAIVLPLYSISDLGSTVYSARNPRVQLLAALLSGDSAALTADSRVELATGYIELISERPILGHGTGFVTGRLQEAQARGPHNTFLLLWAENGLPGLAGYLTLLAVVFWYFRRFADRRGQALCAATFVLSIFNNDVLDIRPLIVALGLLSVFAAPERFAGWEREQPIATRRFEGHAGAGRIGA